MTVLVHNALYIFRSSLRMVDLLDPQDVPKLDLILLGFFILAA